MIRRLSVIAISVCFLLTSATSGWTDQKQPTKIEWAWPSRVIGKRMACRIVETHKKTNGAYIWPQMEQYLLFVTFSNVSTESMPKPGDEVDIESVPAVVGDNLAVIKVDNTMRLGNKVAIVRKASKVSTQEATVQNNNKGKVTDLVHGKMKWFDGVYGVVVVQDTTIQKSTEKAEIKRVRGKVKWFNDEKGFGFISSKEGAEIFVHYTAITDEGKTLHAGQLVEFQVEQGPKGPQASNVRILK